MNFKEAYKTAIEKCQAILRDHITPGSNQGKNKTINRLLGVLDHGELVRLMRSDDKGICIDSINDLSIAILKNTNNVHEMTIKRLREENKKAEGALELRDKLPHAMNVLKEHLSKDKSEGSYYYGWQSNIAMAIIDELEQNNGVDAKFKHAFAPHKVCNGAAKRFLDQLISSHENVVQTPGFAPGAQIPTKDEILRKFPNLEHEEEIIRVSHGGRNAGESFKATGEEVKQFEHEWMYVVKDIINTSDNKEDAVNRINEHIQKHFQQNNEALIREAIETSNKLQDAKYLLKVANDLTDSPALQSRISDYLNEK